MIQSRQQMQMVKESLNDGYCDISGTLGDLNLLGEFAALHQSLRMQTTAPKARWEKSDCSVPKVL